MRSGFVYHDREMSPRSGRSVRPRHPRDMPVEPARLGTPFTRYLCFCRIFICLPRLPVKVTAAPLRSAPEKILSPADAYPVEFQSLNLELSGRHLKLGGGSHIVTIFMIAAYSSHESRSRNHLSHSKRW